MSAISTPADEAELRALVWDIVHRVPAVDPHVRGGDPGGPGEAVDRLLTAPDLLAEWRALAPPPSRPRPESAPAPKTRRLRAASSPEAGSDEISGDANRRFLANIDAHRGRGRPGGKKKSARDDGGERAPADACPRPDDPRASRAASVKAAPSEASRPRSAAPASAALSPSAAASRSALAEAVWRTLFVERSPVSEASRRFLTAMGMLGVDCRARDLAYFRDQFASRAAGPHLAQVFAAANLERAVVALDPLDPARREGGSAASATPFPSADPRFSAALSVDTLVHRWRRVAPWLKTQGYSVAARADRPAKIDRDAAGEIRRLLAQWVERFRPVHLSLTLPDGFPADRASDGAEDGAKLLKKALFPFAEAAGLPVFVHWAAPERFLLPPFPADASGGGDADDGQATSGARAAGKAAPSCAALLAEWLAEWPSIRWIARADGEVPQGALVDSARSRSNVLVAGGADGLSPSSAFSRATETAVEWLGTRFHALASGAWSAEELPARWAHGRWRLGLALQDKYGDLFRTGWRPTPADIERDVRALLGGNFRRFVLNP